MRAVVYDRFGQLPEVRELPDPTPAGHGAVIRVEASGVCRSDWHAWRGHDPTVKLPHVPGHELAGVVQAVGPDVRNWSQGDRVTIPFVGGCGSCRECRNGNQQICDDPFEPGFTSWGSFAEFVGIGQADLNLVRLPDTLPFTTAAALGCRFVTGFRAVVDQGQARPGQWLAVHGCGGVGLSAVMIGVAIGARVIAVDITSESLQAAAALGAEHLVDASQVDDVVAAISDLTDGGVHLSLDALGITQTCTNSINSLRKRGRHVQVGWMLAEHRTPPIPMEVVMGKELEIVGSHGMAAHRYKDLLQLIDTGQLSPERLVHNTIDLDAASTELAEFDRRTQPGMTVIAKFG